MEKLKNRKFENQISEFQRAEKSKFWLIKVEEKGKSKKLKFTNAINRKAEITKLKNRKSKNGKPKNRKFNESNT